MAGRIRTIKPEWRTDEKMKGASDEARVLSVALITLSDDYGNGEAGVLTIAGAVWGSRDPRESLEKSSRALRELVEIGYLATYSLSGSEYFHICNWSKHQRVDKPGKPRYPGPLRAEIIDKKSLENLAKVSREFREAFAESLAPDQDQDQDQEREREKGSGSRVPRESLAKPSRGPKPASDRARRLADQVWEEQEQLRRELKLDGIGTNTRGLSPVDPAKVELVHRISERLPSEADSEILATCRHVLSVLEHDCREQSTLKWLNGQHWRADRFSAALTREPGEPFRSDSGSESAGLADFLADDDEGN